MSKQPRFEIVRTDAGWHARFVAANGRIVWHTENYVRREGALNAVASLQDPQHAGWLGKWFYPERNDFGDAVIYRRDSWNKTDGLLIEISDVDERAEAQP